MYQENSNKLNLNWFQNQPDTYDFLRPNGFKFLIKDLPNVNYTCQGISLPGVGFGNANFSTPFVDIPVPGDKLQYGTLTIRYIISEEMQNYLEIYNWLIGLGFPDNYNQYASFIDSRKEKSPLTKRTQVIEVSDGTLSILSSANNPKIQIYFKDLFPVDLGSTDFDLSTTSVDYLTSTVTFKYKSFDIEII